MSGLRSGKLPPELLTRLLQDLPSDDRILVRPGVGRDAAAVSSSDRVLVLTADPVSFTTEHSGWCAVHVSANDIACLGGEPRWFLATVIVPPAFSELDLCEIMTDIRLACDEVGAIPVGGHTEVSEVVTKALVSGAMVGEADAENFIHGSALRPGDVLLQVGYAAIEGTAILAHEAKESLIAAGVSRISIDSASRLLFNPGISVLPMARVLWKLSGLHILHDPTEGGISTGAWEISAAAGLGVTVDASALLIHPLTQEISTALDIDPIGLLASGALLAGIDELHADNALKALHQAGFPAQRIGYLGVPGEPGILLHDDGTTAPLPQFEQDEVVRVLAKGV